MESILFQFGGVTKTYGAVRALNNLSLSVPVGAIGLLGPNGSGKTTMIRALLGLISLDSGTGEVLGFDIRNRQLDIRRLVGFAPENECLFPHVEGVEFVAYAGELVGMSPKDALQRAHEVLDYVELGEARYRKVESYSTGMKQRLKLASAIVHDPKLLVLDEPTNGMDPAGRKEVLELAHDLAHNKGMNLIFSSHILPDVEAVCDYVVVLGSGQLLAQGEIEQLRQIHEQSFDVRLKSDSMAFAERLTALGCSAQMHDDVLRVRIPADKSEQLLWEVAAEQQSQIRQLQPQRSTLEEVFLSTVECLLMPVVDQGYQHWTGELSGHAGRWLAITRRGVKTALRLRLVRFSLLIAWIPAIVLTFVLCMWGLVERQSDTVKTILPFLTSFLGQPIVADPREYRAEIWTICFHTHLWWELWFAMILVLLIGPNLISQDLRYNALPLYLSRPLRRIDYFAGKLGVIVSILGIAVIVPTCVAYVFGLLFSLDASIIRDTWRILAGSLVYGVVVAVSAGMLMLALSSVSRNSRYIALLWIGLWLITSMVSTALDVFETQRRMHATGFRPHMWSDQEFLAGEIEAAKKDWRPLISYTSNLQRIEEHLLGTNASWKRLSELSPAGARERLLWHTLGAQYPWYWSAAVLAGLMAISMCILHFSVKSLDQLK